MHPSVLPARFWALCTWSLCGLAASSAVADEASHLRAVRTLFKSMNSEASWNASVGQIAEAQVRANQKLAPFRKMIREFLEKHMGWKRIESGLTRRYADAFSEQELNEINRFYQSKAGQKFMRTMPKILQEATADGTKRVQANIAILQKQIDAARARAKAAGR